MENPTALQIATQSLVTIEIEESVASAHHLMREKKIRHLVVQNQNKAVGIVSDRDIMKALKIEIDNFNAFQIKRETLGSALRVGDIMSWPIKSVDENTSLQEVLDIVLKEKISSLMVTKANAVVGILTTDDLLELLRLHLKNEHLSFWGEDLVNNAYSTPVRTLMEILANTGI